MIAPRPRSNPVDPIDPVVAFAARCEARALLVEAGALDLHEAVDTLHEAANASGLVHELGQDAVQSIMAGAFAPAPTSREDEESSPPVEINRPQPRAAGSTVDALLFSLRAGVAALGKPETQRRIGELSEEQLHEVGGRLQRLKPEIARAWTVADIERLVETWGACHA
jgi:hypothetical protein